MENCVELLPKKLFPLRTKIRITRKLQAYNIFLDGEIIEFFYPTSWKYALEL